MPFNKTKEKKQDYEPAQQYSSTQSAQYTFNITQNVWTLLGAVLYSQIRKMTVTKNTASRCYNDTAMHILLQ